MTDKQPVHGNFIAGEWVKGGREAPDVNPSDLSDVVGMYAQADATQARAAVVAAHEAFASWQFSNPQLRFDVLDRIGSEVLARRDELGRLLSREEGKILSEGIGEATRAGYLFKFFAGEALRPGGELLPSVRSGVNVEVTREPVGPVTLITPWNFPIAIPAWKIAPALCYGNTVVFKPAELVPGCASALAEIISRSGLPKGVFNLVMGRGSELGDTLVDSPEVSAISFTGSVGTGSAIIARAAARKVRVQAEMGGKNPLVILDDADLEIAVSVALNGAYFSTGQRCTASSRFIVTAGLHDRFVQALTERLRALRVGHALSADTEMGPVVDQRQLDTDLEYVAIGKGEGARLQFGGRLLEREHKGYYLEPTLFTETTAGMRINREEIFGPVATVIRARDYEEALQVANDTPFGLSSGIVTTSLKHATDFRRRSQVGMVMVNLPTAGVDYHVPFGGRKGSSHGPREQGRYAAEFYTAVKTSYVGH
jgi:aldehyde dehydrogenase (NAD+)